jgi:hypothetical protein
VGYLELLTEQYRLGKIDVLTYRDRVAEHYEAKILEVQELEEVQRRIDGGSLE